VPVVNPLEIPPSTNWVVRPITDFATDFRAPVAKGAKDGSTKPGKPPSLLTLATPDLEGTYAAECKAEADPGSTEFDQEKMVEIAAELEPQNPCK